jgi:hypothetical protein
MNVEPVKTSWWMIAIALAAAARANAGPLADALARHGEADVETLRAQRADIAARCTLGAVYARRGDLARAHLYLETCVEADLPGEVAGDIAKIRRDLRKQLRDGDLSKIEVLTRPEGMTAEITALPGETFTTPATVWVAAGTYEVRATQGGLTISNTVTADVRSRAVVILEAPTVNPTVPVPKTATADFTQENAAEKQTSGPPPDIKRPSLMSKRYRGVVEATGAPLLEDPLAVRLRPRAPRSWWLGVRLGAGMFDDGEASARVGAAVAASARFALTGRWFAAARLDWSRRGGEHAGAALDTFGASAGLGATVLERAGIGLALIGQLRGDLRLVDQRAMMPVSRGGASLAAGAEVALPSTPITAGVRFEHGLTELVPGARDRAVLVEVGVDLR